MKIMKELFKLQSRETFEEIRSAGRIKVKFVERQIFVNKRRKTIGKCCINVFRKVKNIL